MLSQETAQVQALSCKYGVRPPHLQLKWGIASAGGGLQNGERGADFNRVAKASAGAVHLQGGDLRRLGCSHRQCCTDHLQTQET